MGEGKAESSEQPAGPASKLSVDSATRGSADDQGDVAGGGDAGTTAGDPPSDFPPMTVAARSHDYSLWVLPPLSIGAIAVTGQLYGSFWAAFVLAVVVAWIVGAVVRSISSTDSKPLPHVAIGVGAGIILFAVLISQRPGMVPWLDPPGSSPSPSVTIPGSAPTPTPSRT